MFYLFLELKNFPTSIAIKIVKYNCPEIVIKTTNAFAKGSFGTISPYPKVEYVTKV